MWQPAGFTSLSRVQTDIIQQGRGSRSLLQEEAKRGKQQVAVLPHQRYDHWILMLAAKIERAVGCTLPVHGITGFRVPPCKLLEFFSAVSDGTVTLRY